MEVPDWTRYTYTDVDAGENPISGQPCVIEGFDWHDGEEPRRFEVWSSPEDARAHAAELLKTADEVEKLLVGVGS